MREPGVEPAEQQNARMYNQPAFFLYKPSKKPPTAESPVSIQNSDLAPEAANNAAMDFIRKLLERYLDSETSSVSGRETALASILSEEHRKDIEKKYFSFHREDCRMLKNVLLQQSGTGLSYEALDHKKGLHIYTKFKKCSFAVEALTDVSENCLFVARCSVKAYPAFL